MALVRKFDFDLCFDAPPPVVEAEPEPSIELEPPPPSEPTFTVAELEAARAAAREEGFAAGLADGEAATLAGIEARSAAALDGLGQDLAALAGRQAERLARIERQSVEVTLAVVKLLFPALTALAGTTECEAVIADALAATIEEPRLILRAAAPLAEALEPKLTAAAERAGFAGRLTIIADSALAEDAVRLEWAEGGVERDPQRLMAIIESAAKRGLSDLDRRHDGDATASRENA
jgi:flagellar assembly protein FliH